MGERQFPDPIYDADFAALYGLPADTKIIGPAFPPRRRWAAKDFSIGGFIEYLGVLSQIGSFTLEHYVDPKEGGRGPFGHLETVRTIGHSRLIDN